MSLPDAGYFKPGEWETLATEAQRLHLLPGDLSRGLGYGSGGAGERLSGVVLICPAWERGLP